MAAILIVVPGAEVGWSSRYLVLGDDAFADAGARGRVSKANRKLPCIPSTVAVLDVSSVSKCRCGRVQIVKHE
jgi:hypothetical protein